MSKKNLFLWEEKSKFKKCKNENKIIGYQVCHVYMSAGGSCILCEPNP